LRGQVRLRPLLCFAPRPQPLVKVHWEPAAAVNSQKRTTESQVRKLLFFRRFGTAPRGSKLFVRAKTASGRHPCRGFHKHSRLSAAPPTFGLTPPHFRRLIAYSSYSAPLTTQNGTGPYTWSIVSGALPSGLSINPSSGVISGSTTVERRILFIYGWEECWSQGCTASR